MSLQVELVNAVPVYDFAWQAAPLKLYGRPQEIGTWTWDDVCWFPPFPFFGAEGRSCSNSTSHVAVALRIGSSKALWHSRI